MPENKRHRYKILKWVSGIVFFVFVLLAAAAWFLNFKSKPVLSSQIKTLLYKSTDSLYTISFTNVTTNILTGNATLQNVKIVADTNRYKQLVELKRAPNNLYQVSLKKLVIKHFHPFSLYKDKKLQITEILFDRPEVIMTNKQLGFNEGRPPKMVKSPYEFISKKLKEFSIETIRFKDVSFKYINKNILKPSVFSIDDLNITLIDLLVDSTSWDDPKRLYLLKDVVINLNNYTYATPDKMYHINLNQLDLRASTGKLRVKKFSLEPLYDEMKFGQVAGYAKDRFNIQLSDILLTGIDLPLYIKKQLLSANEMTVANGFVSVFNNNSLPKPEKENKIGRYPHQLLQQLDAPISLKKILLKDIDISYALYNKASNQRGRLSFEKTSGTITNVTNVASAKATNPIMEAKLSTYLMGQGKFDINFKFNLAAKNGAFSYAGVLGATNARVLNQITKPLGLVQINRGNVDKLEFNFDADDFGSKGKVNFWYYDLSVALMKNDPDRGHLVRLGLLSFLANALIINSENPNLNGDFISAPVVYQRPENTSFFNLIWKSLFIGIKHSVGITEEKQNEMREHIQRFKLMQESHKLRKMKRMQRRQQRENQRRKENR
jgi:hypothetical protein